MCLVRALWSETRLGWKRPAGKLDLLLSPFVEAALDLFPLGHDRISEILETFGEKLSHLPLLIGQVSMDDRELAAQVAREERPPDAVARACLGRGFLGRGFRLRQEIRLGEHLHRFALLGLARAAGELRRPIEPLETTGVRLREFLGIIDIGRVHSVLLNLRFQLHGNWPGRDTQQFSGGLRHGALRLHLRYGSSSQICLSYSAMSASPKASSRAERSCRISRRSRAMSPRSM